MTERTRLVGSTRVMLLKAYGLVIIGHGQSELVTPGRSPATLLVIVPECCHGVSRARPCQPERLVGGQRNGQLGLNGPDSF